MSDEDPSQALGSAKQQGTGKMMTRADSAQFHWERPGERPPPMVNYTAVLSSHDTTMPDTTPATTASNAVTAPPPVQANATQRPAAGQREGTGKMMALASEPSIGVTVGAPMRRTFIEYLPDEGIITVCATHPDELQSTPYMPWAISLKTQSITALKLHSSALSFAVLFILFSVVIIIVNFSLCGTKDMDFMGWKMYDCTPMGVKNIWVMVYFIWASLIFGWPSPFLGRALETKRVLYRISSLGMGISMFTLVHANWNGVFSEYTRSISLWTPGWFPGIIVLYTVITLVIEVRNAKWTSQISEQEPINRTKMGARCFLTILWAFVLTLAVIRAGIMATYDPRDKCIDTNTTAVINHCPPTPSPSDSEPTGVPTAMPTPAPTEACRKATIRSKSGHNFPNWEVMQQDGSDLTINDMLIPKQQYCFAFGSSQDDVAVGSYGDDDTDFDMLYNCCQHEGDGYSPDTDKGLVGSCFFFWLIFLVTYHVYCFLDTPPVFELMNAAPYWRISFLGWSPFWGVITLSSFNGSLDDYKNLQGIVNKLPMASYNNPMC